MGFIQIMPLSITLIIIQAQAESPKLIDNASEWVIFLLLLTAIFRNMRVSFI